MMKGYYKSKKPKGYMWQFTMAQCDSCRVIGMLEQSERFIDSPRAVDLVFDKKPKTIYEYAGLAFNGPLNTFCSDCMCSMGLTGDVGGEDND